jgi:hypothetical protein
MIPNLTKYKFHDLMIVLVPTKRCQLSYGSQNLNTNPWFLPYKPNTLTILVLTITMDLCDKEIKIIMHFVTTMVVLVIPFKIVTFARWKINLLK